MPARRQSHPASRENTGCGAREASAADSTPASLLHVERLAMTTNGTRLINDASFSVARGQVLGLAGENGSGKTLTGLSIIGLLPPGARAAGRITFGGADLLRSSGPAMRSRRPPP